MKSLVLLFLAIFSFSLFAEGTSTTTEVKKDTTTITTTEVAPAVTPVVKTPWKDCLKKNKKAVCCEKVLKGEVEDTYISSGKKKVEKKVSCKAPKAKKEKKTKK